MLPRRSRATALALAVLAAPALSGCEKPKPGITVQAGNAHERVAAGCWSFEEASPVRLDECARPAGLTLPVAPGEPINISVDDPVAEARWIATVNGRRLTPEPLEGRHYRFAVAEADLARPLLLQVIAGSDAASARGLWSLTLERR